MSKLIAKTLVVVFLVGIIDRSVTTVNTNDALHDLNERIFSVIDDLFITLKINTKLIKSKEVEEYMAMHSFIQDVLNKNQGRYKEIRNKIKTTINNKNVDQISGVNDVIDEMIKEQTASNISNLRNYTKPETNITLAGLVDLARLANINTKALIPNDFTLSSSNASQEVEGRRIFAGSSTGIARYPFMVSVHVAGRFVCAGSLLHESLALSAASCLMRVRDEPDVPIQIRVGSDFVTKMGYLVNIDRIIFHPDFDRATLANNLVLLKSKKPLRFIHRKVVAIKYDKWDSVLREAKDIVILGWGRRGPSDKNSDDQRLSRARINLYDLEECKYIYTKEYVTDKTFCAGFVDRGEGACNHDGGGPALVGSLLTGVISFGSPHCGRADAPTVFTRLGRYSDWIDSVLDSVTITKGALANTPQQFEVPYSIEDAVESDEIDAERPENPRDILEKEFGIKDILHGPIDTSKVEKSSSTTANNEGSEEIDNKKLQLGNALDNTEILNEPFDSSKASTKSNIRYTIQNASNLSADTDSSDSGSENSDGTKNTDQIKLSDDSEEITTTASNPEDRESSVIHYKADDSQGESKMLTNLMQQLYESEILQRGMNTEEVKKDSEETTIKTQAESNSKLRALRIGNQGTNEDVALEGKINFNFDTKNGKPKEDLGSPDVQYDVQYQVEMKPVLVPRSKTHNERNNSLIILSESGTTQRIEVNNAETLQNRLKIALKALVKHINMISIKEQTQKLDKYSQVIP